MIMPESMCVLRSGERLTSVRKEPHVKRRHGRASYSCYVVRDRMGVFTFVGQKLPVICKVINELPGSVDPLSRVSLNGMWQAADRVDGRAGPFCKGRWAVRRVDLEDVGIELDKQRADHAYAVVCTDELECYNVSSA